ncbi:MAG TPA: alpha/beta hydrolase [Hyphomonadaceae bacterium]|nr:alpha/beta hydrolase [Hyphomonadaceae bacterium]
MPSARINGIDLFYEDTGGTGPTVIFSHGLLMDHEMFAPQVEVLRDKYRCIAWDERGHGRTARDTLAPFTYYDSANDLAALLNHLGIKQAVLAGMSQGGFLSMRCALTHPGIVRALVLIDTQAGLEDPAEMVNQQAMSKEWVENGLSSPLADAIEHIILGDGWSGAAAWRAKWATWKPANLIGCLQTLVGRDDITDSVSRIKVPTLVIHGDADAAIPMERAQVLVDRIPNSELVVIPGGGHAANLTHPAPVNTAIKKFLERLPA